MQDLDLLGLQRIQCGNKLHFIYDFERNVRDVRIDEVQSVNSSVAVASNGNVDEKRLWYFDIIFSVRVCKLTTITVSQFLWTYLHLKKRREESGMYCASQCVRHCVFCEHPCYRHCIRSMNIKQIKYTKIRMKDGICANNTKWYWCALMPLERIFIMGEMTLKEKSRPQ